jgi:glucose/arabinose dehydrogenase
LKLVKLVLRWEAFRRSSIRPAVLGWALLATLAPLRSAPAALTTELVASALDQPVFATFVPGDADRLFIVEQPGTIRILDIAIDPPAVLGQAFADITSRVNDSGYEQGLLGLAFHPNFEANRRFYVSYTNASNALVISRFEVPPGTPNRADENSEQVLMTIVEPQTNHNAGWLGFGPNDGLLYIATGDGGGTLGDDGPGHTPGVGNSQDITDNLLGKILRIDVDASDGPGGNYGIPPSNPFVGVSGDDEIWAFGLRNPWRNAFDAANGDLYIADVGQDSWEEINFQPASSGGGENWGWRCREGAHDFDTSGDCTGTMLDPIHEFAHGGQPFQCSITGGEVYRGCAIPEEHGTYFYADFCSNRIWSLSVQDGVATDLAERTTELDPPGSSNIQDVSSFGRDAEGEIYIVDRRDGEVFQIVPVDAAVPCAAEVPSISPIGRATMVFAFLVVVSIAIGRASSLGRRPAARDSVS